MAGRGEMRVRASQLVVDNLYAPKAQWLAGFAQSVLENYLQTTNAGMFHCGDAVSVVC